VAPEPDRGLRRLSARSGRMPLGRAGSSASTGPAEDVRHHIRNMRTESRVLTALRWAIVSEPNLADAAQVSDIEAVLANNVRAERSRRRLRQEDLAARLGWSRTKLADIESGRRRVLFGYLPELCRALDVSLEVLLVGASPEDVQALKI
jgi:DNA-binding Xre family transcriptional regulator